MMEIKYASIKKKKKDLGPCPNLVCILPEFIQDFWVSAKSSKTVIKKDIIEHECVKEKNSTLIPLNTRE